jgi:hypothetical protein
MVVLNKDIINSICKGKDINFSNGLSNNPQIIEVQTKQRKGSMSTQYKTDKLPYRNSKSIFIKKTNLESLSNYVTPTHYDQRLNEKYSEEILYNPNASQELKSDILKSFKLLWGENKLRNYESIHNIYIFSNTSQPNIENGLLTCKMKLSRDNMKKIYSNYLKKLNEKEY